MTNPPGRPAKSRPELRAIETAGGEDRKPGPAASESPAPESLALEGPAPEGRAGEGTDGATPAGSAEAAESARLVPDETLAARRAARRARRAARAEAEARRAEESAPEPGDTPEPSAPAAGEVSPEAASPKATPPKAVPPKAVPPEAAPAGDVPRTPAQIERARKAALRAQRAERAAQKAAQQAALELSPEEVTEIAARQPEVRPAKAERRHLVLALSFGLLVLLPFLAITGYLYLRAADQYHSQVAFSIRSEDAGAAASGLLGALTSIGSGSASDTDILFEFIRSQKIVEEIEPELDLRAIYNRAPGDFWFSLGDDRSIEALHAQWNRMVDVSLGSAGIIEVSAKAFNPEDARAIAEAILAHSSALVNRLSEQARGDAIQFASGERDLAEANLKAMRQKMIDFRRQHRLVDPSADVQGQAGLLNALQSQLAQALVDRDMLRTYASDTDQRMIQANRRIDAITERIDAERGSLGVEGVQGSLPDVLSAFEELRVDLEFANTAYTQALAALAGAKAEAGRQSRYLAPHIQPTLAQTSLYPRRAMLAGLSLLFLTLGWGVLMLVYYNVRDNR